MADSRAAGERSPRRFGTGRLEAFSDGVFAIAITLLVLEIAVPSGSSSNLLGAVLEAWPSYLAYIVSFSTIGALWLAHTAITDYLDRADANLMRLNLLLLLVVSFLPFPTRLLAEYVTEEHAERVAATAYGLNLFMASLLISIVWRYAVREHLLRADAEDEQIQILTRRLTPGMAGYVILLVVGLFLPVAAVFGYLAIAAYFLVPFRSIRRRRAPGSVR